MFEELLKTAKANKPLTKEQLSQFNKLTEKEKEQFFKVREKAREKELNKVINGEFKRVYNKLLATAPEIASNLATIANVDEDNFMEKYHDDRNYTLNEVMIAVIRDDETPENIKNKVREKIYNKNIGLIGYQLKRFYNKSDGKMSMEDLGQECRIVFFTKAIDKFDLSRNAKFSTFATTVIHNYLAGLHKNKINKERALEVSLETPIVDDGGSVKTLLDYQVAKELSGEEIVRKEVENKILYESLNKLTLEQKFVAYCRYGLGGVPKKTQAEIADYMHMSQANVSKIEGMMRTKLKQLLDEAGMF